jgi:hypothetical protein
VVEPSDGWVQVWFALSGSKATAFGMAAEVLSPDRVRLPRAPWFPLNAAKRDVFRVQRGEDDELWVRDKIEGPANAPSSRLTGRGHGYVLSAHAAARALRS